jgi:murein DD-endopeptidase MepM/ murein hydrolase activator NlpD
MEPIKNAVITFPYGAKYRNGKTHQGVDFRASIGTPFVAMVPGVVVHVGRHVYKKGWGISFGKHVIIDNDKFPNGSPGYWAIYAHLSQINVSKGQRIQAGQLLGLTGNTGNSTAPHLHVGICKSRFWNPLKFVNPQRWINA